MRKFIILKSLPGAGKSFLAKQLQQELGGVIVSTNNYWVRPDDIYDFNYKLLGQAHKWNYDQFVQKVDARINVIILDNTNITYKEFKNYVQYAKHDYDIEIREPTTEWKYNVAECFKRNSHNVPLTSIENMWSRWETTESCLAKIGDNNEFSS